MGVVMDPKTEQRDYGEYASHRMHGKQVNRSRDLRDATGCRQVADWPDAKENLIQEAA